MPPTFVDDGVTIEHPLELKFNCPAWDILSAIERGKRTQTDVKGKLAEWFLYKDLVALKDNGVIDDVTWQDDDDLPDFDVVIGGRTLRMECKNVRSPEQPSEKKSKAKQSKKVPSKKRASKFDGLFRVEIQKTRNQLAGGKKLRGYRMDSWHILAVCLFNEIGTWTYLFVETALLPRQVEFPDYLVIMQPVPPSPRGVWKGTLAEVLNDLAPEIDV